MTATATRTRAISAGGIIQTVIGGGTEALSPTSMAVNIKLDSPDGIAAGPDGALYIAQNGQVIRAFLGIPQLKRTNNLVPSRDGRTLYRFDERGKHLETIDVVTGLTALSFTYDASGLLEKLVDADGNKTTIARDPAARQITPTAPDGQATVAHLGLGDDIAEITDPLLRTTTITWDPSALVEAVTDPKSKPKFYLYDLTGRLLSVSDPTGYTGLLSRTDVADGWNVAVTAPVGRTTNYTVQYAAEKWTRTRLTPDGRKSQVVDGGANVTQYSADGTKRYVTFDADPTFGAQSLNPKQATLTLPSGKSVLTAYATSKEMVGSANPLDLSLWTDTETTNGRQHLVDHRLPRRIVMRRIRLLDVFGQSAS